MLAAGCGGKTDTKSTTTTTVATSPPAPTAVSSTAPMSASGGSAKTTGAGQPPGFDTEAAAQAHCTTDTVVWLNTKTKVYHEKGMLYYGHTKQGAYVCKKEADAAGDRETKNGK
jgi:hypothetical protein